MRQVIVIQMKINIGLLSARVFPAALAKAFQKKKQ
jgi:hypothetical protein